MAFGLGGILKTIVGTAFNVFKLVTGNPKPALEVILPKIGGDLFSTLMETSKYEDLTSKEKIDSWLETMDKRFGSEESALDLINTMTPQAEEEMSDGILQAVRSILYHRAKVPGYYQEAA